MNYRGPHRAGVHSGWDPPILGPDTKPGAYLAVYVQVLSVLIVFVAGIFIGAIIYRWVFLVLPCGRKGVGQTCDSCC